MPPLSPNVRSLIRQTMERLDTLVPPTTRFDDETQDAVFEAIDRVDGELEALNKAIHDHPELAFHEKQARRHLVDALTTFGFSVSNPSSLPTAFVATWSHGTGGRTFGLNAEYDALPGVGHACGHNLIALVAVAAAVGLKAALKARNVAGTIRVIGSPAEEGGGGKVILLNEGVYGGLDACVMAHPEGGAGLEADGSAYTSGPATLARAGFAVELFGKGAHAGAAPWLGVNALDAAVQGYAAVSMLRQQLEPSMRVHGVLDSGKDKWVQNIIPAYAKVEYSTRALSVAATLALRTRVIQCFKAAAEATGCTYKVHAPETEVYAELRNNTPLADAYADFMTGTFKQTIGREGITTASTDFGNVTYAMPAIHPGFNLVTEGVNHTPEFTTAAGTRDAHERAIKTAKGLAMVGAKFLADDRFAKDVKRKFDEFKKGVEHLDTAAAGKVREVNGAVKRPSEEVDETWM